MSSKPCGRLDAHPAHDWTRHPHIIGDWGHHQLTAARTYRCERPPRFEGGWTCLATNCTQPAVEGAFCDYHGRWVA